MSNYFCWQPVPVEPVRHALPLSLMRRVAEHYGWDEPQKGVVATLSITDLGYLLGLRDAQNTTDSYDELDTLIAHLKGHGTAELIVV